MEVKKWLQKNDINNLLVCDYKKYMDMLRNDDPGEFQKIFGNKEIRNISYKINGIALIRNYWHIDEYEYISARLELIYNNSKFGVFEAVYNVDGKIEDGYFRLSM